MKIHQTIVELNKSFISNMAYKFQFIQVIR